MFWVTALISGTGLLAIMLLWSLSVYRHLFGQDGLFTWFR